MMPRWPSIRLHYLCRPLVARMGYYNNLGIVQMLNFLVSVLCNLALCKSIVFCKKKPFFHSGLSGLLSFVSMGLFITDISNAVLDICNVNCGYLKPNDDYTYF